MIQASNAWHLESDQRSIKRQAHRPCFVPAFFFSTTLPVLLFDLNRTMTQGVSRSSNDVQFWGAIRAEGSFHVTELGG